MQIAQAVFLGDWFRAHPANGSGAGTARSNIRWLAGLMTRAFNQPLVRQRIVMPDLEVEGYFEQLGQPNLAELYREDPLRGWLASYDSDMGCDAFAALYDGLKPDELIIGFELPPAMRRRLASAGRRYVSVHVHPLRFLPDLAFGVYSNCPILRAKLEAISVSPDAVARQVSRLSARIGRLDPPQAWLPENCAVLFGQTKADASLIVDGRFSTWYDHADKLAALIGAKDNVAYIRHPHAQWPRALLDWFGREFQLNVIAMEGNSYPIIMSGRPIGPMISLSSSVGVEAAAFGHESHFLIANPEEGFAVAGLDNQRQIMVGHQVLEPEFWNAVPSDENLAGTISDEPFILGPNYVRSTLEAWSFVGIEGKDDLPECGKIIMPWIGCGKSERDRLRAALGTVEEDRNAGADRRGAVRVLSLPFALEAGGTWQWNREEELLDLPGIDGLGPIEEDGVWLGSGDCHIRLPLADDGSSKLSLSGELSFSFFRGLKDRHPVLLLRANGKPVAAWIHRGEEDPYHNLPFAFVADADSLCQITVEVSHADSPAAMGLGADSRQLSVLIHSVSVTAAATQSAGSEGLLSLWGFGDHAIELQTSTERQENVTK